MDQSRDLIARRRNVVPPAVAQFAGDATAERAEGAIIIDSDGREVIDFAGGIGVMNVGHSDPTVVEAICQQARKLQHACIHVATYEPYVALCEKLVDMFPHGDQTRAMLVNSGAEAVENAIKIARQATGRPAVICFTESFHGRTLLATSLTSKVGYKAGCGPFAPEIYRTDYPNLFRDGSRLDVEEFSERALDSFRRFLVNTVRQADVAAVILECIQGEGGFVQAPASWLRGLRELCDEHGIILIFDEVQAGFCRTGKWASYQHSGVTPDLSTWAKSMGGGLPISAVIGKASVMDQAAVGTLGGTYGGNPVSCAAALATIRRMEELDLNTRAEQVGQRIRQRFLELATRCPQVADVRGLGAMQAIEMYEDDSRTRPATSLVHTVIQDCLSKGVLVIHAGSHGNILRVLCPLVITDEQLDQGLDILCHSIMECSGQTESSPA
ncbi:MAG: 4-aminobutyrate--2-oxoglutarate transaminase [Phycisphaerae bacterium]|nr:4-aminobutyrate--2-oxoglutarate transaminase [Phycisphaerae bacterium]